MLFLCSLYREIFEHCLLRFLSTADANFLFEELQFQEVCCSDWLLSCVSFSRVPPNNRVRLLWMYFQKILVRFSFGHSRSLAALVGFQATFVCSLEIFRKIRGGIFERTRSIPGSFVAWIFFEGTRSIPGLFVAWIASNWSCSVFRVFVTLVVSSKWSRSIGGLCL